MEILCATLVGFIVGCITMVVFAINLYKRNKSDKDV